MILMLTHSSVPSGGHGCENMLVQLHKECIVRINVNEILRKSVSTNEKPRLG